MTPLQILQNRHSVRTFNLKEIPTDLQNKLKSIITDINTHEAGLKFQLFFNDNSPFDGFNKSYGTFENPNNFMAAVVDPAFPDVYERAGYFAEEFVVRAVEKGLGTCFVGGTYDPKSVNAQIRAGEKILFLVVFGYPSEKKRLLEKVLVGMVHIKKMVTKDFFEPKDMYEYAVSQFPDMETGLEAVACAPSSLNKRPVRIFIRDIDDEKRLCAKVDDSDQKNLIDLGIAKFNFNFATSTQCEWGNGSPLTSYDVDNQ